MCLCASVVSHLWVWLQTGRLAVNDKTTFQSTYWIYTDVKNRDEQGELWAAVFKYQHPCIRMCNTNENFIGGNVFHPKWESIGCGRSHLKSQHLWGWCRITTIIPPPPLCTSPCKKKIVAQSEASGTNVNPETSSRNSEPMIVTAPGMSWLSPLPLQTLCHAATRYLTVYQAHIIAILLMFSELPCCKPKEELVTLTPWLLHPSLILYMPFTNGELGNEIIRRHKAVRVMEMKPGKDAKGW